MGAMWEIMKRGYFPSLIILGFLLNLFADPLQITDFTQVTSCDYLIICPDSFISCGVKLATYRNSYQFDDVDNARAVSLSTIIQKFSVDDSLPHAFSIWYALKYATENWSVKPEYVVLLGDDSVKVQAIDSLDVKLQSAGLMPTFFYSADIQKKSRDTTKSDTVIDYSDASYLTVAFDSVPPLHRMEIQYDSDLRKLTNTFALGRIPVRSLDECTTYINKVIRYESQGTNYFSYNRMILTADDAMQGEVRDPITILTHHQQTSDNIVEKCLNGCFLDKTYLAAFPRSSAGKHENARAHFFDAINKGARCALYFGHGHPDLLSDEDFLRASDVDLFSNDSLPAMFFSFSCSNGEYLRKTTPQMCKTFLLKPNGGCIAYIAAPVPTYAVANERFGTAIFSHFDSSRSISIGKALTNAYLATWDMSNFYYGVLGDPALKFTKKKIDSKTTMSVGQNGDISIISKTVSSTISPLNYHYQISIRDSVTCIDGLSPKYIDDSIVASFTGTTTNGQIVVTIPKSAITEKTLYTLYAWDGLSELRVDTTVYGSTMTVAKSALPNQTRQFSFSQGILTMVLPIQSHSEEASVALYSVNGTLIKTLKLPVTGSQIVADIRNAHLPAGNYIFKLTAQGQQLRGMFCTLQM
jgi:hypothetical protein